MRIKASWVAIALLLIFHAVVDLYWIHRHTAYNGFGEAEMVENALDYADFMDLGRDRWENLRYFLNIERPLDTPRFLFFLGDLSMRVFGRGLHSLLFVMVFFHALTLLGTYLFGRETTGEWPGVFAAALVALYPNLYDFSRAYNTYAAHAALFILALFALVRSRGFIRLLPTYAFIGLAALDMLTDRGGPPIFLVGPVLVALAPGIKETIDGRARPVFWINVTIGTAVFALLVAPYLKGFLSLAGGHILERATSAQFDKAAPWFGSRWPFLYYLVELGKTQAGLIAAAAFYLSLPAIALRTFPNRGLFAAALIVPVAVFSTFAAKDAAFLLAWLPIVVIATAHGVNQMPKTALKVAAGTVLLAVAGFNFANWSFDLGWVRNLNGRHPESAAIAILTNRSARFSPRAPDRSWTLEYAAARIDEALRDEPARIVLRGAEGPTDPHFDLAFALRYRNPRLHQLIRFTPSGDPSKEKSTEAIILPIADWDRRGCAPPEVLARFIDETSEGGFSIRIGPDDDLDREILSLRREPLFDSALAPGFPYRVFRAWPPECGDK